MIMRFWSSLLLCGVLHICQSVYGSLIDDIVNAITQAVDCGSCHALLVPLKGLAALGNSPFSNTMAAVCKLIGVRDLNFLAVTRPYSQLLPGRRWRCLRRCTSWTRAHRGSRPAENFPLRSKFYSTMQFYIWFMSTTCRSTAQFPTVLSTGKSETVDKSRTPTLPSSAFQRRSHRSGIYCGYICRSY